MTQRVLTQTLRRLERNGMIERRVLHTSPVGVEYSLTPLGESHLYGWTLPTRTKTGSTFGASGEGIEGVGAVFGRGGEVAAYRAELLGSGQGA